MTTPRPILPQMPRHIKEKIIKKFDFDEKVRLRRCSKDFKTVIDESRKYFESVRLADTSENGFKLMITEGLIEYEIDFERGSGIYRMPTINQRCRRVFRKKERGPNYRNHRDLIETRNVTHVLESVEPLDVLSAVISFLFKDQRIRIQTFTVDLISQGRDVYTKLQTVLSNMDGRLLSVEHLQLENGIGESTLLKVLPYLKPRTLQIIEIETSRRMNFLSDRIQNLEQWQQAICVKIDTYVNVDYEHLLHFKFVTLYTLVPSIEKVKLYITKAEERGEQFEQLWISGNESMEDVKNYIETEFPTIGGDARYCYKRLPGLDYCLRFSVGDQFLDIRRVSSTTLQPTDDRFQDI